MLKTPLCLRLGVVAHAGTLGGCNYVELVFELPQLRAALPGCPIPDDAAGELGREDLTEVLHTVADLVLISILDFVFPAGSQLDRYTPAVNGDPSRVHLFVQVENFDDWYEMYEGHVYRALLALPPVSRVEVEYYMATSW